MALSTLPFAGQILTASALSTYLTETRTLFAIKTADQSQTSNATPIPDAELFLNLQASHMYIFSAHLFVTEAANAAGKVAYTFTFPSGATVDVYQMGLHNSLASGSEAQMEGQGLSAQTPSPTGSMPFGASTSQTGGTIFGRIVMGLVAGALTLNWAQQSSNSNATTLKADSWLQGWQVA